MPGTTTPMPSHAIDLRMIGQQTLHPNGQLLYQHLRIANRGKRNRTGHRRAEQVGQHQERLAGADVGRHHGTAAGIDIEEGGLAAAHVFAGRAFEDQSLAKQVVDDQGDRTAPHVHGAGQVGA